MDFVVWFSIWLCWFLFCLPSCSPEKEILEEDVLERTNIETFKGANSNNNDGKLWIMENGHSFFETCGTGLEADFWLITKHVNINSSFAEVIYVDVEAEISKLCLDPGTGTPVSCYSNYFGMYIHRGEKKPVVNQDNLLNLFSPLYKIHNNATESKHIQRFFFAPNGTKGVTFAIRSKGACGKIFNMTMYYYFCEETFVKSVRLKKTSSPVTGSKLVTALNCSENTKSSDDTSRLEGYCSSNGTWKINKEFECFCIEGHEPDTKRGCSLCSLNHYKQNVSNSKCTKCPKGSVNNSDSTSCMCEKGLYRNSSNQNDLYPCYKPLAFKERPTVNHNESGVTIRWSEPDKTDSLDEVVSYDVKCFLCENKICNLSCENVQYNPGEKNLKTTWVVVTKLKPGEIYVFRVYPKNSLNNKTSKRDWNFTETKMFPYNINVPTEPPGSDGSDATGNIVIAVTVVLLFVLIVVVVIFACRRRGNRKTKNMQAMRQTFLNNGVDLPNAGQKPYVDPTNYSSAEEAVHEFANELDPNLIFLERLIGGGEFGDVYKGEMTISDKKKIPIAVKTLKHDASSKSARDFMLEASVMSQFDNPNVVRMEGVVTKIKPRMIVIEYMSNGSLDNYLKSNDGILSQLQLLGMARGVANGMNYLAEIKFVHRDLAARNVLVNDELLCKISDFGLSRELESEDETSLGEYATTGGKIPIRWTAPEAIKYRKFTTASDVWSFGILLWEIMSFSQRPYWEWNNYKVLEEVENGFRLPAPQKCPGGVHGLMLHCWKAERSERPSFAQITIVIDRWIKSPETLDDEVNFFITIGEWLASIKMGSYKTMFVVAGYKKQSDIVDLKDEDLKKIGVTLIGHRNKIMKGIEQLKARKARKTRQSTPV